MLGHRLEETSQHSGVSLQPAFSRDSELGRSINPNSCLLGVGGGQSPPTHTHLILSQVLFPSFPLSYPSWQPPLPCQP